MAEKVHWKKHNNICDLLPESETEILSLLCMYVGPLQDKEQKCSTQNSTQTLLIKVISLKEEVAEMLGSCRQLKLWQMAWLNYKLIYFKTCKGVSMIPQSFVSYHYRLNTL